MAFRRRICLPRGGRTRGTSESPEERLLPGGSQGQKQTQIPTKRLMAPSKESSRKSGLFGNRKSPSPQPWSAPAPTRLETRPPPRATHATPRDAALARHAPHRPHPGGPSPGASPPPLPPAAALKPPEPNCSRRPDFPPQPRPRTPGSAVGPTPRGPSALPAAAPRRRPGSPRSPSFPRPTHTPRRRHRTLPPQPWPRPFPRGRKPEAPAASRPAPDRTQAPATPPTAGFRPAPEPWLRRPGLEEKGRLEGGRWRLESAPGGGAGPWRESQGPLLWPARSSHVSLVRGRGGAQPWGENGVGLAAPGLRLPPLLRLLPFPRLAPGEG